MATHSSVLAWRIPGTEEPGVCCLWGRTELDMTEATQQQQQTVNQQKYILQSSQLCLIRYFLRFLQKASCTEIPNYSTTRFFQPQLPCLCVHERQRRRENQNFIFPPETVWCMWHDGACHRVKRICLKSLLYHKKQTLPKTVFLFSCSHNRHILNLTFGRQ